MRLGLLLALLVVACGAEPRKTDGADKVVRRDVQQTAPQDAVVVDVRDAGTDAEWPITDLTKHPCHSERDCDADQYCGTIGRGFDTPGWTPPEHPSTYCLHKNSGEGFPPAAPPRGR